MAPAQGDGFWKMSGWNKSVFLFEKCHLTNPRQHFIQFLTSFCPKFVSLAWAWTRWTICPKFSGTFQNSLHAAAPLWLHVLYVTNVLNVGFPGGAWSKPLSAVLRLRLGFDLKPFGLPLRPPFCFLFCLWNFFMAAKVSSTSASVSESSSERRLT